MAITTIKSKTDLTAMLKAIEASIKNTDEILSNEEAANFSALLGLESLLKGMVEYGDKPDIHLTVE